MSEDTYLSHPVRRMREDSIESGAVTLVVRVETAGTDRSDHGVGDDVVAGVETAIEEMGGSVTKRLEFGTLLVQVRQAQIEDLCSIPDVASIETDNTIGMAGDAGEDV